MILVSLGDFHCLCMSNFSEMASKSTYRWPIPMDKWVWAIDNLGYVWQRLNPILKKIQLSILLLIILH